MGMERQYRLGSFSIYMTDEQFIRWNECRLTLDDEDQIRVCVPDSDRGLPGHREFTLLEAYENFQAFDELVTERDLVLVS
jgi:hypothetical protein